MTILLAERGREPIGISQEPGQGGYNYPLLFPSADIEKLLADLYLAYIDNTNRFTLPFHVEFLHGFGDTVVAAPITPVHSHDVRIRDAEDLVVFDTLLVTPAKFRTQTWDGRLEILEWLDDAGQILRIVYHTHWDANDSDAREYDSYIAPASAVIDGRAIYQMPQRLTSLQVGLTNIAPDDDGAGAVVDLVNGFNTTLEAGNPNETDGARRETRITINVGAGTGKGRFGPGCDDTFPPTLRRINNLSPTTRGNFILDATGCYRVEQPVQAVLSAGNPNVLPRELQVRDHTLLLSNDCGPCCDCQDFINVWEAIRNQRDRYADLVARAQTARDQYHTNRERWLADAACREADRTRAVLQPTPENEVGFAIGFCNSTLECLKGIVIHISFEYLDGTGLCFEPSNGTQALFANTTATFLGILPGTTFRSGNVDPQNTATGGRPSVQEYYQLSGSYPHFWMYFDGINPAASGSTTFRAKFAPGDAPGEDIVEAVIESFHVGANPLIQPNGTFVEGYVLGEGPLTTPSDLRLQVCPIKRAATLIPAETVSPAP